MKSTGIEKVPVGIQQYMCRTGLLLLLVSGCAQAQTLSVASVAVTGVSISPRQDGATAWDPVSNRLYVFGGSDAQGAQNDLWSFSIARQQWSQVAAGGAVSPARRFGHTLVYDSARRRLVVFGGQSGGFFSDVWAYDIAANVWQQLAPDGGGPPSRYGHSAIYDPKLDRLVISHGFTTAGRFDDTWAFDLKTNSWKNITPAGTRPTKRCLHHAVLDEAANTMYLYGGCSSGFGPCPQDDLWALDLATNTWQALTATPRPPGRFQNGLAFDAVRRRVVVFGGVVSGGNADDVWEYDIAARTWQIATLNGAVTGRARLETTVAGNDIYFFGGNAPSLTSELLRLRPAGQPRISSIVNAFSGAGNAVAPGEIISLYGQQFGPTAGVIGEFSDGRLPQALAGVSVTVNGAPASLLYVRNDQINALVPVDAGVGAGTIAVRVDGTAGTGSLRVDRVAPGLFPAIWNSDFRLNSAGIPAAAGSIIVLFATGHGVNASDTAVLRIGGVSAPLLYAGPVEGTVGLLQLNARIPEGTQPGTAIPVTLAVGGVAAQDGLTIAVR